MAKKKITDQKQTINKVLSYTAKYKIRIFFSIIFAAATVVLSLAIPVIIGRAIDLITKKNEVDLSAILQKLLLVAVFTGINALLQWLMNTINNKVTFKVVCDIRNEAFGKIQTLPLSYIDSHSHGDIVSRIIADADQFADGLLMGFTQLFTGVLTIIGTLGFMLSINVKIALLVVVLTPLSLFVARFIANNTYNHFKAQSKIRGEQTAVIEEYIGNQKIVQAFGYEDESLKMFDEINDRLTTASVKAVFFSSLTNPCTRFINSIIYAVVVIAGGIGVIKGLLSVGSLSCLLSYANQYTKPFNEISGVITELQNALACASRLFELIEQPSELQDNDKCIENVQGRVELKNVNFSYSADKKLIQNFNLHVKKGQRVAIVGPTGCGKTTLINLLMRFYDVDSGSITVDGYNIYDIKRSSLRSNYGMVLQETWLKSGTVRDNIIMGKPNATQEEIEQAAKATHAHTFIKRLPDGYDTIVSDTNSGLSQGQKQLLCITRIMLSIPPMLILDEATSSIDTRTEMRIQRSFAKMMNGRTSFIVAHRLSTIKEADIILVMKDGNIIEQGSHDELLALNGFYTNLYNSQFSF